MHYMEIVSGLLIAGIGLYILIHRLKFAQKDEDRHSQEHFTIHAPHQAHSHGHHSHAGHHHSHGGHSHGHTFGGLTALGISGGIIPCPAALAVLLAAISLGHPTQGFLLVVVFSLGLASVLIALGLIVVKTASVASERVEGARFVKWMPVVSAAIVTILGLALLLKATIAPAALSHEHPKLESNSSEFLVAPAR
jgi:nickel/cobalt exporter